MSFIFEERRPPGFELFVEFATGEQDAALAALAHEANIRAESNNLPLVGPARMLFPKADDVADVDFYEHRS